MSNLVDRIARLVRELDAEKAAAVGPDTDLFEAGVLDSFGMIEYIAAIEREFGIQVAQEDLIPQNLWTINAAAALVQRYL